MAAAEALMVSGIPRYHGGWSGPKPEKPGMDDEAEILG